MSTRGLKFIFSDDEKVLCFEPDPTKARVLYNAKVLECAPFKTSRGHRRPGYLVHFNGWNSSWDRIVPESFILESTESNRELMHNLASIARKIKNNKKRKRKIDNILKQTLKYTPRLDSDIDESSSEEEGDAGNSDGEDDEIDRESANDGKVRENGDITNEDSSSDLEETKHSEEEEEHEVDDEPMEVELNLPENLKHLLEEDCYNILKKKKLVNLPAKPNVITILEGYVKNFAANILCATAERPKPGQYKDGNPPKPERNIDLCKEVMEGIRVYFDFTLPTVLLYGAEKPQYHKMSTSFKPAHVDSKSESRVENGTTKSPTKSRHRGKREAIPLSPSHDVKSPKHARLSPREIKREPGVPFIEPAPKAETAPRRLTRQSIHASAELPHSDDTLNRSHKEKLFDNQNETLAERRGTRLSRLSSRGSESTHLSDRVTPPPPLLIPSTISSATSSLPIMPSLKAVNSTRSTDGSSSPDNDTILNEVMSWKLVPTEIYLHTPTPPSVMYGAHHLLRLFVKLPDLLAKMTIPDRKMKVLLRHIEMFLEYLSIRHVDLFPDVYIDAPDTQHTSKHSRR